MPHNAKNSSIQEVSGFYEESEKQATQSGQFLEVTLSGSFLLFSPPASPHPLLEKLHDLLDTVIDVTGVRFQHQLRGLRFLILRIDPREALKGQRTTEGGET